MRKIPGTVVKEIVDGKVGKGSKFGFFPKITVKVRRRRR